jgi:GntR family transcriptional regulator of vanillate catabolism
VAGEATRIGIALREGVLAGRFAPGERLAEIPLAEALGTSRTPVRLALAQLEAEGLVEAAPGGGFTVRRFTLPEIEDAIALRGTLEGMAARLVAETGLPPATRRVFEECLADGDAALAGAEPDVPSYEAMNARLHAALAEAAGNLALSRALAVVSSLPFAGASALLRQADSRDLLRHAHHQHRLLAEALAAGQGARAEALMREHAENARRNLRAALAAGDGAPARLIAIA